MPISYCCRLRELSRAAHSAVVTSASAGLVTDLPEIHGVKTTNTGVKHATHKNQRTPLRHRTLNSWHWDSEIL